jgi:hypothetical protein
VGESRAFRQLLTELHHRDCRPHRHSRGYRSFCPAHGGSRGNSLSIRDGGDRALIRCFAGCPLEEILLQLGWAARDLFDAPRRRFTPGEPATSLDDARLLAWALGVQAELADIYEHFPCVLYSGERAVLRLDREGRWCYYLLASDAPEWPPRRLWTLAEVYAARASRAPHPRWLRPTSRVAWQRLLEVEATLADIPVVEIPARARELSPKAQRLARGYARLCAIRADLELGTEPVPYTRRFAGPWNGMTKDAARRPLEELYGVLVKAGEHVIGRHEVALWEPWPLETPDAPRSAPTCPSGVEAGSGEPGLVRGELGGVETFDPAHELHELELVAGAELDVGAGGPLDAVDGGALVPHGPNRGTRPGGRVS